MGHDERAHQSGTHAPTGCPSVFGLVLFVEELYVKGLSEILSQEVACSALQGLAVLHHGFDGVGVQGSGKSFGLALHTLYYGYSHILFSKFGIYSKHLACTFFCFFFGGVGCVAFLPQEFCCAQEQACTHFPSHYVTPLVAQNGQVAVRVDPVLESVPDNSFACGTDDEFFFQSCSRVNHYTIMRFIGFQTVVCNHSTLLGKTFNMFSLSAEE